MNMLPQSAILVCLMLFRICEYGECEQVYIIPSLESPCPALQLPCYTLMEYINSITLCQSSNVALTFVPGNHILGTDFSITNKTCFSMSTVAYYNYNASSSCTITCINSSRMDLSLIGTVLVNGLSFMKCGGNIARNVNRFLLKNSNFTMDPHSAYMYRGRAWSVFGSEILSIDNCIFTNNSASHQAGALYVSAVMNITITACTFISNTAGGGGGRGGVVYISATNSIIDGSIFFNNSIQGGGAEGGALYVNAVQSVINNSTFECNTIHGGSANGGALYIDAVESVISSSTFECNAIRGGSANGGALYIDAVESVISSSTFECNAIRGGSANGGALYIDAVESVINSSKFECNTIYGGSVKGGALYVNAMESVINSSSFERNMVHGGSIQGAALYVRAANSSVGMSTFISNTATHGVPWYIIASSSIISHDATYEGIELYQTYNYNIMALTDGICKDNNSLCNL